MEKSQGQNSGLSGLFFSTVVGAAGILTALLPFFDDGGPLNDLFIDHRSIKLSSLCSVIVFILTIWFFSSLGSYVIFGKNGIDKLEKMRFYSVLGLISTVVLFYTCKILYENDQMSYQLAVILQCLFYMISFLFLAVSVGISIQASSQTVKNQEINDTRIDRIIQVLVKSGIIPIEVKIFSVIQLPYNSIGYEWAYRVEFEVKEDGQVKSYEGDFHGDFTKAIIIKEKVTEGEMESVSSKVI